MKNFLILLILFIFSTSSICQTKQHYARDDFFFKKHVLLFFYESRCMDCQQFSPVLKNWAKINDAKVLPLSLDNAGLKEFPYYLSVNQYWIDIAFQDNQINYPALFIMNNYHEIFPVSQGYLTFADLDHRLQELIEAIKIYEKQ